MLPVCMNARAAEAQVTTPRGQLMGIGRTLDNLMREIKGLLIIDIISVGMIGAIVLVFVNILLNPIIQMVYVVVIVKDLSF